MIEELIKLFDSLIEKGYWCRNCSPKYCLHITKEELLKEIKKPPKSRAKDDCCPKCGSEYPDIKPVCDVCDEDEKIDNKQQTINKTLSQ